MMRTYTRKRPHHQLIEDVHELCRLCLDKAVEAMPIFTDDANNICATLALRIMICVGLEMKKEECLPNVICTKCYNELNKYYAFRKNCETTYQKLKSHVIAFKENLYKQNLLKEAEMKKELDEENESRLKFENDQFPEVSVLNLNGVVHIDNFVDQLPELTKVDSPASKIKMIDETEHHHHEQNENQHHHHYHEQNENELHSQHEKNVNENHLQRHEHQLHHHEQNENEHRHRHHHEQIKNHQQENENHLQHQEQQENEHQFHHHEQNANEHHNVLNENEHHHHHHEQNRSEQQPLDEDTFTPDITTFLSTMLLELGILTQQEDGLVYSNQNIKSLELETGDGSQIMLELVEEDDVEEQVKEEINVEHQNKPKEVNETTRGDECVIKYGTATRRGRPKKLDKKGGAWCEQCGKRLANNSALTRHMRVHSGERPYACDTCHRRFAQREVMLRHLLVHEEERPHKCPHCDKSFTQRGALVSHARAHAPPHARALALHRCDRCPKVFLYASGLSRHMMMHNGRVYVCGACGRQFKDKSSLLRHLKTANHTPGENSPT